MYRYNKSMGYEFFCHGAILSSCQIFLLDLAKSRPTIRKDEAVKPKRTNRHFSSANGALQIVLPLSRLTANIPN